MSAEQNKATIRAAFAGIAAGNGEPLLEALDDDIQWTIIGNTSLSRTFNGKQDVIDGLLGPFAETIDGHAHITPLNMIAEGDYVAVQGKGEAKTKAGVDYSNTYCWVYKFSQDKIVEITEYLDTELVRRAFG